MQFEDNVGAVIIKNHEFLVKVYQSKKYKKLNRKLIVYGGNYAIVDKEKSNYNLAVDILGR